MNTAELSSSLRSVISGLHKGLRKQVYSAGSYSLTEMETIDHLIRNATLLPSELAALTRITTQSMSQLLNKLEKQGVIARTPSRDDKRKVYVSITGYGKKMVEKTKYDRDERLKGIIERLLTTKEKERLIRALPVLNKLIASQ